MDTSKSHLDDIHEQDRPKNNQYNWSRRILSSLSLFFKAAIHLDKEDLLKYPWDSKIIAKVF